MSETGKFQVRFEQFFATPRPDVFAFFSDHAQLGRVLGVGMQRIREGGSAPNGEGSVRRVRALPFMPSFEETITRYESPSLIEYRVTRGGPIKNHLGRMEFSEEPGGTRLNYTISFDPRIPFTGRLISAILNTGWCRGAPKAVAALSHKAK